LRALSPGQHHRERRRQGVERIEQVFHWVTDIDYHGHRLQWLECLETVSHLENTEQTDSRFVHLTNLAVTAATVAVLSHTGRLRWKIEKEGFNTQKPLGYALQHKYARVNWQAAKNYYQVRVVAPKPVPNKGRGMGPESETGESLWLENLIPV
jgi:hypothetical protein